LKFNELLLMPVKVQTSQAKITEEVSVSGGVYIELQRGYQHPEE
jgi:hypothetical protein